MAQEITTSSGGAGVRSLILSGTDMIVHSDVVLTSDDDHVLNAFGGNTVLVLAGASLHAFDAGFLNAAIEVENDPNERTEIDIGKDAEVTAYGAAINVQGGVIGLVNHGRLVSRDLIGVELLAESSKATNHGTIFGGFIGLRSWQNSDIVNFGDISGRSFGVALRQGGGTFDNFGRVEGEQAVWLGDSAAPEAPNRFVNAGEVIGERHGVFIRVEEAEIVNSGLIVSAEAGVGTVHHPVGVANVGTRFVNAGEVLSIDIAYQGGDGVDDIVNSGRMIGDIRLADADDRYVGRQGSVEGAVSGGAGADLIVGGAEENTFAGGGDDDVLRGRGGDDSLSGDAGEDTVNGGAGDDVVRGGTEDDRLLGKAGDDDLHGEDGLDLLLGHAGDDGLYGGAGGDALRGHAGDDVLGGGRGADLIIGGKGDDVMTGGQFIDTFVIRRRDGEDEITDFENGTDVIDLQAFGLFAGQFNSVVAPALSSAGGGASFLDLDAMGGRGSVLIQGLAFSDADASDFIL
ncbi:MAG: calcium-binding protein [Pseudomonadota bacterium]